MRSKSLITLLVLAILLVGAAVSLTRKNQAPPPADIGRLLLPDLPLNDVVRVEVAGAAATTTVERVDGRWVVREKDGYPANFDRLRQTLIRLTELKIGDVVRGGAEARAANGLGRPGADQPDTLTVTFADAGGRTLAGLILGKVHMRKMPSDGSPYGGGDMPDGRFVAPLTGDGAYRVKDALSELVSDPMPWIDTQLVSVEEGQLKRITIAGPGRDPLVLERDAADVLALVGPLADDEEPNPNALSSIRNALAYLNFQNVARAMPETAAPSDSDETFTAEARDGRVFHVALGDAGDTGTRRVRLAVTYTAPATPSEDTNTTAETVMKDVEKLHAQLSPWVFMVPTYKTDAMATTRAAAVQPKTKAPAEGAASAEGNPIGEGIDMTVEPEATVPALDAAVPEVVPAAEPTPAQEPAAADAAAQPSVEE